MRISARTLVILALAFPLNAVATPSGLNNIPTADTAPKGSVVLQGFSDVGNDRAPLHTVGVKAGVYPGLVRLEVGADSKVGAGQGGPIVFQGKAALDLGEQLPSIAVGSANLGVREQDRDRVGEPFSYAVLAYDLEVLRAHAGYALQHSNNTVLLGVDKTVPIAEHDFTLRADARQIDDRDQWLGSIGFITSLTSLFVLEGWVSEPFDEGPAVVTGKLNFILNY